MKCNIYSSTALKYNLEVFVIGNHYILGPNTVFFTHHPKSDNLTSYFGD